MNGEPKYDVIQIKEAYDHLMGLDMPSAGNAFWEYLHLIIWHKGIDRVDWILQNKSLVNEIIKYESKIHVPDELDERIWNSIRYYKNLMR